ncbi:MAG: MerR family transcriptional regulator [Roseburia sp.]|nr:MerR family transcriptional regulator [Roseburia sp.]
MEKVRYMISDAANIVNVESHVLRYWEDELELSIPRNEMGHRYYTKENIQEFQRIKELKEQGYQLKAIRMIVHNQNAFDENQEPEPLDLRQIPAGRTGTSQQMPRLQESQQSIMDNTDRMAQFTDLMTEIVGKAIAANNEQLSRNISEEVGEQVLKEMNYLMREREEAEEERFRNLDAAIRGNLKKKEPIKVRRWGKRKKMQGEPEGA